MAIGKYILMPWPYLSTPWFQALSGRQVAVFLGMLGLSRMDKGTGERQLKASLRVLGKEIGMSKTSVGRTIDELVDLEVVAIVAKGDGRQPAVYELAEPVGIRCAASGPGSGVDAGHNGDLRPSITSEGGTQGQDEGEAGHNGGACVPGSRVNAGHYIYPPRGGASQDSPSLGTGTAVASRKRPSCEQCGTALRYTNTYLPGGKYRVWECPNPSCLHKMAICDADGSRPGQPVFSTPRPRKAYKGGQDAATAKYE